MSKNTSAPVTTSADRANAIVALRIKGDRYGHAAIAGLAHELALNLNGDKLPAGVAKALVESTGYDKGTVSRVGKIVREDRKARGAALKLNVMTIDTTPELLDAAVKVGEMFKRQPSKGAKGEKTAPDMLAILTDWLLEDGDAYEARKSQVEDLMARMDDIRAQVAADAAAEAEAA
jgi:hypothetical protein